MPISIGEKVEDMAQAELPGEATFTELAPEAAFRALQPEMAALAEDSLVPINIDILAAATAVMAKLPKLNRLRPEIVEQLPKFDLDRFDRLGQYALALNQAQIIHRGSLAHRGNIIELSEELVLHRDRLLSDALSLSNYGYIDAALLKDVKKTPGYRALAADVFLLVKIFKENWSVIQNRTPVTAKVVQDAGDTAVELLAAVVEKEGGPTSPAEAQAIRQRAFTLFYNAYEDARAAVAYLRRGKDEEIIDDIAPSLFVRRGRSAPAESSTQDEPAAAAAPKAAAAASDAALPVINNPHNLPVDPPFN